MVDLGLGEYITQVPSTRYPVYTRGNAGEVWPEVAYPLTITLTRKAGEIASAQAAINAGVITPKDIQRWPHLFWRRLRRLHVPEFIFWKNDSYPNARNNNRKE